MSSWNVEIPAKASEVGRSLQQSQLQGAKNAARGPHFTIRRNSVGSFLCPCPGMLVSQPSNEQGRPALYQGHQDIITRSLRITKYRESARKAREGTLNLVWGTREGFWEGVLFPLRPEREGRKQPGGEEQEVVRQEDM